MDKYCSACEKATEHYLADPVLMRYVCDVCTSKKSLENQISFATDQGGIEWVSEGGQNG